MADEKLFTHQVLFECPKCQGELAWLHESSNPNLSDAYFCRLLVGVEVWCEPCGRPWKADALKLLGIARGDWIGEGESAVRDHSIQ